MQLCVYDIFLYNIRLVLGTPARDYNIIVVVLQSSPLAVMMVRAFNKDAFIFNIIILL